MGVQTEINRLNSAKAELRTYLTGKGKTVSNTATLDAVVSLVKELNTSVSDGTLVLPFGTVSGKTLEV